MDRLGLVPTMPGSGPLWTSEGKADVEDAATLVACVTTGSGERSNGCGIHAAALAALATNQMTDEPFGSSVLLKLAPKKSPPVLGEMYVPKKMVPSVLR